MKLIKLTNEHYIICDDSEIKEGDWLYSFDNGLIVQANKGSADTINSKSLNGKGYGKITHSTQPLECDKMWTPVNGKQWMCNTMLCCGKILNPKTKPISLQEVKELIGEVDVEKRAEKFIGCKYDDIEDNIDQIGYDSFIRGYNQALEDNKEKKYTEEDIELLAAELIGKYRLGQIKEAEDVYKIINSYRVPKTEWEVEFVDGKLKLKNDD